MGTFSEEATLLFIYLFIYLLFLFRFASRQVLKEKLLPIKSQSFLLRVEPFFFFGRVLLSRGADRGSYKNALSAKKCEKMEV